jgi:hypothetical protein
VVQLILRQVGLLLEEETQSLSQLVGGGNWVAPHDERQETLRPEKLASRH